MFLNTIAQLHGGVFQLVRKFNLIANGGPRLAIRRNVGSNLAVDALELVKAIDVLPTLPQILIDPNGTAVNVCIIGLSVNLITYRSECVVPESAVDVGNARKGGIGRDHK